MSLSLAIGPLMQQGGGVVPPNPAVIAWLNNATLREPQDIAAYGTDYVIMPSYFHNRVSVIDVSPPGTPAVVGSVTHGTDLGGATGIAVSGTHAFVCCRDSGLFTAVDLTTPSSPTITSTLSDTLLSDARYVVIDGTYAYVTSRVDDSVVVVDISNPAAMTVTGIVTDGTDLNGPMRLAKSGNTLFVCVPGGSRLTSIDVTTPATPTVISSVADGTNLADIFAVAVSGTYAYVGTQAFFDDRLSVIDITDPNAMTIEGSTTPAAHTVGISQVVVVDGYVHATAYGGNAYTVFDVSTPASPTIFDYVVDNTNLTAPNGFAVIGRYAFVARDNSVNTFAVVQF